MKHVWMLYCIVYVWDGVITLIELNSPKIDDRSILSLSFEFIQTVAHTVVKEHIF